MDESKAISKLVEKIDHLARVVRKLKKHVAAIEREMDDLRNQVKRAAS